MNFFSRHITGLLLLFSLSVGAGYVYAQTVRVPTDRRIASFTFAAAAGATNQSVITVTCLDVNGNAIPFADFEFWLSNSADGGPIATTSPVGTDTINIVGSIGVILNGLTTTQMGFAFPLSIRANVAGQAKVGVLNAAKTLFRPVARPVGNNSSRAVGTALTTGNYGFIIWGEVTRGLWAIAPRMVAVFGGLSK